MYTAGLTGMLRPGMKADLVVLDRDLVAIVPEQIKDARVLGTVVNGRVVFRASEP
jgi:predicted amidohydrolase YtcJ